MRCGGCVCKYINWCQKHLFSVHICTCTGTRDTCLVHATLTAKKCTYTRVSTSLRRCSNFFAIGTIATHLETWILPKRPSKHTPTHNVVVVVLSHRHHLIIHVVADPIQLANDSPSLYATDAMHHIFLFPPIFWREFSNIYVYIYMCVCVYIYMYGNNAENSVKTNSRNCSTSRASVA